MASSTNITAPADPPDWNGLITLADAINVEHGKACFAIEVGLEHARRAGELLLRAKAQVAHGEWLPWLQLNVTFSARTAQGYMRVASRYADIDANTQPVAHLSLREGLKLLAEPESEVDSYALVAPAEQRKDRSGETVVIIAEEVGTTEHEAQQALAVQKADPELLNDVAQGKTNLKDAAKTVAPTKSKPVVSRGPVLADDPSMHFYATLREGIKQRRKDAHIRREQRKWDYGEIAKDELIRLLDWIEDQLDEYPRLRGAAPPTGGAEARR